jgi:chromosome segregation ATPase
MTTPQRPTAISTEKEGGGIFSSIAALKQILMLDSPTRDILNDKNHMLEQLRYEEQKRAESKVEAQNEQMEELKSRVDALKKESEKERFLRKTLETTYEALSEHKKQLTMQLEMISNSRDALEEKVAGADSILEALEKSYSSEKKALETKLEEVSKEKDAALEKTGNLEGRLLTAEREIEELKAAKAAATAALEAHTAMQEEIKKGLVDGNFASSEILKKQLEAAEEARTKATTEVRCFGDKQHFLLVFLLLLGCVSPLFSLVCQLAAVKVELEALKEASNKSSLEEGLKELNEKSELKQLQEKYDQEEIRRRSFANNLQKAALKIVQLEAQTRETEKRIQQSEEKGKVASEELATTQTSLQETQDKLKESQEKVERYQTRIVEVSTLVCHSSVCLCVCDALTNELHPQFSRFIVVGWNSNIRRRGEDSNSQKARTSRWSICCRQGRTG